MKTLNFVEWWVLNREKLTSLAGLWFVPKKIKQVINTIILVLDYAIADRSGVSRSLLDDREVLPCIRVNPDGSTSLINCKTGLEIPKKD